MLDFEINVSKSYQPPYRKLIYKNLFDVIHYQNIESNLILIKKESDLFGLLFLCDGATISIIPLLNIMISGVTLPVAILELIDCRGHLADGGGKDESFICT